jgi:hypothetical protein
MAAMSTTLQIQSASGPVVYVFDDHTAMSNRKLFQSSSPAIGNKRTSQDSIRIVYDQFDADGVKLPEKDSVEIVVKRALYADATSFDATFKTRFLDIVNSDEFWNNFVGKGLPIKSI